MPISSLSGLCACPEPADELERGKETKNRDIFNALETLPFALRLSNNTKRVIESAPIPTR